MSPSTDTLVSVSTVMKVTQILFCILFSFITPISTIETRPPAEPLLIHDHPFVAIWSAPTSNCRKHEILLDLAAFSAVTTPALEPDQFLITYYEPRLGLYPRIHSQTGMSFEGGIPQNGSLEEHLKKVKNQIPETLTKDSSGLVVIDWESWRPLWDRNWGSKKIYRDRSIDHARKINQSLAQQDLIKLAKRQFEEAGRKFMVKTISLGIIERPCRLWGFYLFPDCYNYGWEEPGYTGRCSEKTKWQNDQLLWLWEKSKALFPSVYISQSLGNSTFAKLYVRNRVQEAMRVAELPHRPHTVPVYVYSRPLFRDQSSTFLSQMDLVSTVGEIAAVGASGVVMWGSSTDYDSKGECESLSRYLKSTLNPYIANVTAAAMLCSRVLCQGKGRCTRKNYDSTHYLHLNPSHFNISQVKGTYVARGIPSVADVDTLSEHFTCQCYVDQNCEAKPVYLDQVQQFEV
ncbi:hyaluronidase PH-20 isoform X2 [Takifugu rubripes]|uniref:Hyaluronidase n=1 Tax=Takifugu rubripes TaxID=31033 RepID=H2UXD9_TAKRU|nr:hyaluronidase PH-20 isoform X2 [Takifugu rubripes]|eukprot:XP_003967305.1 PREDICTED: hyaluronidase PH-20 [Takifugu rubripes]